ncbi:hypothetical protein [Halarcobacter sp.]|uniref:hypothetical protein n=1 Tax=Halarcobacter sp. TaxID=2321133 RepID=UPI002AA85A80|nr:hypothetical protein [Halarcobacter sp.]
MIKKYRYWVNLFVIIFFGGLGLIVIFNFIVDPFQQYRKAFFYTFDTEKPRYLNAGLAKNYDYDSVLIGSSMVENFYAKDIEKYLGFKKVIKLATRGGTIYEEMKTLETAINNQNVKNVLFGLDIYAFSLIAQPVELNEKFPEYLYDDDISNDIIYLLNFSVLKNSIESLFKPYNKEKINENLNSLYSWQREYSSSFTLENYKLQLQSLYLISKNPISGKLFDLNSLKEKFDNVLLPIIKKNKDKNFYIFYPPYSVGQYKIMELSNYFENHLKFKKYIFNKLKKYKNIKIYDFQCVDKITHDLKNYKDLAHYSEDINLWMLKQISNNNYLVTSKNVDIFIKKLNEQTKKYDISGLLQNKN